MSKINMVCFSYSRKEKELIVEILKTIFEKSTINNVNLFFNFYSFLLFELYDHVHHESKFVKFYNLTTKR